MKRNHKLLNWIADRGYYIALGVCVLAVGISAILFVHSLRPAKTEAPEDTEQQLVLPTLSDTWLPHRPAETKDVPAAVMDPIVKPGAKPTEPVRDEPEIADPSAPTDAPAPSDTPAAPARLQTVTPLEGAVSQPYSMDKLCYNPTTKDWRTHAGLDIAAPAGTVVQAAAAGRVQSVYEDAMLGQTVAIQHDGGFVTRYSNLDPEVSVFVGDTVEAGQAIGAVGKTALLEIGSESHLHFSVYKNNVPQDPEEFLNP